MKLVILGICLSLSLSACKTEGDRSSDTLASLASSQRGAAPSGTEVETQVRAVMAAIADSDTVRLSRLMVDRQAAARMMLQRGVITMARSVLDEHPHVEATYVGDVLLARVNLKARTMPAHCYDDGRGDQVQMSFRSVGNQVLLDDLTLAPC